jgi:hypothetical protein
MPWNGLRIRRPLFGLGTLILLEIVLGIDNLIFIAILVDKLPPAQRNRARIIGLSLALLMRIAMRLGRGSPQRPSEEESRGARRISDCHHLSVGLVVSTQRPSRSRLPSCPADGYGH